MIWEAYQQSKISLAERAADRAQSRVDRYTHDVDRLERHVERLSLACQAMWELLRDNTSLSDQELDAKILEIDARDCQVDGKIGTQQLDCPSCGSKTNSKRTSCVMCGAPIERPHKFEG